MPSGLTLAALYAACLILIGLLLAARVIIVRRSRRIGIGDGADHQLAKRIRAHGNFSEYAPLLILTLMLLALLNAPHWLLHLIGLMGVIGRAAHAYGLSTTSGPSIGRVGGMVLTLTALALGALALLSLAMSRGFL
jgi:uncharacterized protein